VQARPRRSPPSACRAPRLERRVETAASSRLRTRRHMLYAYNRLDVNTLHTLNTLHVISMVPAPTGRRAGGGPLFSGLLDCPAIPGHPLGTPPETGDER